jgi:Fe2+ transport system protein FeoA
LLRCKKGQQVEISRIRGGARLHQKLEQMGLSSGSIILVIENEYPGPMVIADSHGQRQVLGKGMARQILVRCVEDRRTKEVSRQ